MKERKDWNYKFVKFFLDNKHITVLLLALVILLGSFGFTQLKTEGFPEFKIPMVIVTAFSPGAGPETLNETVTLPIQSVISEVKGISQITTSSQPSVSVITVMLEEGADIPAKVQEIRTKVSGVNLPENIQEPNVFVPEAGGSPFFIAVTGSVGFPDLLSQGKKLEENLIKVDGVQSVKILSDLEEKIYIDIFPQFKNPDIINQIKSGAVTFPLGRITTEGKGVSISGQKSINSIEDLKNFPIKTQSGKIVNLDSIASIYPGIDYGSQIHRAAIRKNGGDLKAGNALLYQVVIASGSDILKVDPKIKESLENIKSDNDLVNFEIVFNQAEQSRMQIKEIVQGAFGGKWNIDNPLAYAGFIFGGIWLLIIILLAFLDWRSAIISAVAIPLSFLLTFTILYFLNIQLNTMVLFSLVLVLGLIVDPAIVVIESMRRYIELGHKRKEAALKAISSIGNGVFIAVLTSFVVFLPFGLVSGIFGEIIKYIPLTVIPALIASYFVPMIFLTWIGSKFFPRTTHPGDIYNEDDIRNLWPIAQKLVKLNRAILDIRWLKVSIILASVAVPMALSSILFSTGKVQQVQFSQADDSEFISVLIPKEQGVSYLQNLNTALRAEEIILDYSEYIEKFFYGSFDGGDSEKNLSLLVQLKSVDDRDVKSPEIVNKMTLDLRSEFGKDAGAKDMGAGPPEQAYPVTINIYGADLNKLLNAASIIASELKSRPEVASVRYDGQDIVKDLVITPDEKKIAQAGITSSVLFGQFASILGEENIFSIDEKDVVLRMSEFNKPKNIEEVRSALIATSFGFVPLDQLANVEEQTLPIAIKTLDGEQFVNVQASVNDSRDVIKVQREINDWVKNNIESMGLEPNASDDRGTGIDFEESFKQLFEAIALSIIVTYLIFVIFFKSFVQPFIILSTVPLILIGVFPALVIFTNGQFGFLETLGIIVLIGIVENVAIFLIDFSNRHIENGMDKKDAIALSTGIRFRPIVLTQVTSLAGLLPLAVLSPFWRGLSVVIIAGILSSGILALFTTPILYDWFTRKKIDKVSV